MFRVLGFRGLGFRMGLDGKISGVQGLGSRDYSGLRVSSLAFGPGFLYGSSNRSWSLEFIIISGDVQS